MLLRAGSRVRDSRSSARLRAARPPFVGPEPLPRGGMPATTVSSMLPPTGGVRSSESPTAAANGVNGSSGPRTLSRPKAPSLRDRLVGSRRAGGMALNESDAPRRAGGSPLKESSDLRVAGGIEPGGIELRDSVLRPAGGMALRDTEPRPAGGMALRDSVLRLAGGIELRDAVPRPAGGMAL